MQHEKLHLQELGISTLSALFLNANRDPSKGEAAKADDFYHFKSKKKTQIDSRACDAFFSLTRDSKMPPWAVGLAPVTELRDNQKNQSVAYPRAWVGENVLILCPSLISSEGEADRVSFLFALVDEGIDRVCELRDPDSDEVHRVWVEGGELVWITDEAFEIENS